MTSTLGAGTTAEFVSEEFKELDLKDKRLNQRGEMILQTLQKKLGSCVRRSFIEACEARQAYDFF
jgi:hypothetical protein